MTGLETALSVVVAVLATAGGLLYAAGREPSAPSAPAAPVTYEERLAGIESKLSQLGTLRAEWIAYQEAIEDVLDTVETKRRRIAARDSKNRSGGPSVQEAAAALGVDGGAAPSATPSNLTTLDRTQLRSAARAMGKL